MDEVDSDFLKKAGAQRIAYFYSRSFFRLLPEISVKDKILSYLNDATFRDIFAKILLSITGLMAISYEKYKLKDFNNYFKAVSELEKEITDFCKDDIITEYFYKFKIALSAAYSFNEKTSNFLNEYAAEGYADFIYLLQEYRGNQDRKNTSVYFTTLNLIYMKEEEKQDLVFLKKNKFIKLNRVKPLWQVTELDENIEARYGLQFALETLNNDFDVWIDFYLKLISGGKISELDVFFKAAMNGKLYKKTASEINEYIKNLMNNTNESIHSLPIQNNYGIQFEYNENYEPIDLLNNLQDSLKTTNEKQEEYEEIRFKAEEIIALGENRCGVIVPSIERLLQLPKIIESINPKLFWSRINTLRVKLDGHKSAIDNFDDRKLEPLVASMLEDLVQTINVFIFNDDTFIELENQQIGPQEYKKTKEDFNLVKDFLQEASTNRAITTLEAGVILQEQIEKVYTNIETVSSKQGAEFANKTAKNFLITALRSAKDSIGKIKEGFEKKAGEHLFTAIIANSDRILTYIGKTFENIHVQETAKRIIETILKHMN